MNVKLHYSKNKDQKEAVQEIINKIDQENIKLIMLFVSPNYDFENVSNKVYSTFSDCDVVGATTAGEICNDGFKEGGILAISIATNRMKVRSVLVENGKKYPILYKDKVADAMKSVGLDPSSANISNQGFALGLFNGVYGLEEKLLSVVYSVIKDPEFKIVGGSAGDGSNFKRTFVSHNGRVIDDGCVITFVKTDIPFYIKKENIFTQSGKTMVATKVDVRKRVIYELNGRPAATEYARVIGINEAELNKYFTSNPLGRMIGDEIFIATPTQINPDKSILLYSQILPNSIVDVLEPIDPKEVLHETLSDVKDKIPNLKLIIGFNCLLRTSYFKEKNITGELRDIFNQYVPLVCGFSSYGEQFGKFHMNETLTILALGWDA